MSIMMGIIKAITIITMTAITCMRITSITDAAMATVPR